MDPITPTRLNLRCPACRNLGTFDDIGVNDIIVDSTTILGQRRCPNPQCHAHVFVVHDLHRILVSYPPERIDFDAADVPNRVISALEEAISCHANGCFVATAMMVRKTLEELCRDHGAKGDNLKARIKTLEAKVVLPKDLLDGLDDLRLLGNDAAHVESLDYDNIGQLEVETGIEFTKEVLKAVYQYKGLLNRLQKLKKPASP